MGKIIIAQGDTARFSVRSNRTNFSMEDNGFLLEILYGMMGRKVVIKKTDFDEDEGRWLFAFGTDEMVGPITARMIMDIEDPDCPDGIRQEVDEQIIAFVVTTPCARLRECPGCQGEHDVTYTYINE